MFDAIAPRYDFLNHLLSAGIDRLWRKRAIRSLALSGRECVLDLCTGTGDLAIEAVTAAPGAARVLGVDFSGVMLARGLEKLRKHRLDREIVLVRGDAMTLPVASASVDAVTIGFGIRNVEDREAACREILRVLKPGGRLAILEFAMPTAPLFRFACSVIFPSRPAACRPLGFGHPCRVTDICLRRWTRSSRTRL